MSPKIVPISGKKLIQIFNNFGFEIVSRKGSHIKLQRNTPGTKETLVIPAHREIARGTVQAIYRQAAQYIPSEELKKHLYK